MALSSLFATLSMLLTNFALRITLATFIVKSMRALSIRCSALNQTPDLRAFAFNFANCLVSVKSFDTFFLAICDPSFSILPPVRVFMIYVLEFYLISNDSEESFELGVSGL